MRKLRKVILLTSLLLLVGIYSMEANAAESVKQDGIVIRDITSNSAVVDISEKVGELEKDSGIDIIGILIYYTSELDNKNKIYLCDWRNGNIPYTEYTTVHKASDLPSNSTIDFYIRIRYSSIKEEGFPKSETTISITTNSILPKEENKEEQKQEDSEIKLETKTVDITSLGTPTIKDALIVNDDLGVITGNIDTNASYIEWRLLDNKGKIVKVKNSCTYDCVMYNLNKGVYSIQCRAVGYNLKNKEVYSEWSAAKTVVSQPKFSVSKKNIKKNSITVFIKKIKGVKNYTIYVRKKGTKSWSKVKTTTKSKYKITKFKGRKINTRKTKYDVCVVANKNGVSSDNTKYVKIR